MIRKDHPLLNAEPAQVSRLKSVIRLIRKDDSVNLLLQSSRDIGEAFLFGGMVRDALFGYKRVFGDLDIFVSGYLDAEAASKISRVSRRTNFGGMRLVVGKFDVDIWELSKSHALLGLRDSERTIDRLLSSVCFSTDAVAISLDSGKIVSSDPFNETLGTGIFNFVVKPRDVDILQVTRGFRIAAKTSLKPGLDICDYLCAGVDQFGVAGLVAAEGKWRGRRVLDERFVRLFDQRCRLALQRSDVSVAKNIFESPGLSF